MYTIEPAVLSNEHLYSWTGGEPIVYAVFDGDDELAAVFLSEAEAESYVDSVS